MNEVIEAPRFSLVYDSQTRVPAHSDALRPSHDDRLLAPGNSFAMIGRLTFLALSRLSETLRRTRLLVYFTSFVPCVLKKFGRTQPVPGSAVRRDDGLLLVILNLPGSELASLDLVRGRLLGREEEKNRTRHFLHEIFSSKLLVASFAAHEIYQKLAARGAEGSEELAMVTKLLGEMIDAITNRFGELQTEPIPDLEAASRERLLDSRDP